MNIAWRVALSGMAMLSGIFAGIPAAKAEIVFLEGGQVSSAEAVYAYQHPSLPSVVFVSPETRQMAILPPSPVFIQPPPLLWRAPSALAIYPPASPAVGFNMSTRPSNRDAATYNLQRAHGFSQDLYNRNTYVSIGTGLVVNPYGYGVYGYGYGAYAPAYPYPPVTGSGGFNQPARPSNRDNAAYSLDRAHGFSMDRYRKP